MMDMPNPKVEHSCGLVLHPDNGPEIVVTGGFAGGSYTDTVDIYTVNTDSWRAGNIKNFIMLIKRR